MLIWRVQHKDTGEGMYRCRVANVWELPTEGPRHPAPWNDSGMAMGWDRRNKNREWLFGFSSEAQMLGWLYDDDMWDSLDFHGFEVVQIECPSTSVIQGHTQVVYDADEGLVVAQFSCREYMQESLAD